MTRTTTLSILTAAIFAAAGFAFIAAAQPPGGMPGPQGFGWGALPNLTDTQRTEIRRLVDEHRQAHAAEMEHIQELRAHLRTELFADAPNTGRIEELKGQIVAAESELMASNIDLQLQIANLLTPDQRAAARQRGSSSAGRFRRGGPRGPGRQPAAAPADESRPSLSLQAAVASVLTHQS